MRRSLCSVSRVTRLDELLPQWDARERHERRVPASPEDAVAAALGIPIAPDALVRTLFRLRGLPRGGSVQGALRAIGLKPLVDEPTCVVLGAAGRPWSPRSKLVAFEAAGPGQVRMAVEISARSEGDGSVLATETRVAAMDPRSRRSFAAYWLAVGPFSALVRKRWLAAVERALC
jgi:hypothetical protein